jgi:hypothetical protein
MINVTINAIPYIFVAPIIIIGIIITYTADTPFDWWAGGALMALGFDKILGLIAEGLKDKFVK